MTILYWPGKLQGNADELLRSDTRPCHHEDCPDHGHLIKKVNSPSEKKPRLLCAIQMRNQDGSQDLDNNSDSVPSLSDEEIRVAQKRDPDLWNYSTNTQ